MAPEPSIVVPLRDLLAHYLNTRDDIRLVCCDVGLEAENLHFDRAARNVWQDVLEEAERQGPATMVHLLQTCIERAPVLKDDPVLQAGLRTDGIRPTQLRSRETPFIVENTNRPSDKDVPSSADSTDQKNLGPDLRSLAMLTGGKKKQDRLRAAVVQVGFHPATTMCPPGLKPEHPLEEPSFNRFPPYVLDLRSVLLVDVARSGLKKAILRKMTEIYLKEYKNKILSILEFCQKQDVDLVVFPEFSIPGQLVDPLSRATGRMTVLLGSHRVDSEVLKNEGYRQLLPHGLPVEGSHLGVVVSPVRGLVDIPYDPRQPPVGHANIPMYPEKLGEIPVIFCWGGVRAEGFEECRDSNVTSILALAKMSAFAERASQGWRSRESLPMNLLFLEAAEPGNNLDRTRVEWLEVASGSSNTHIFPLPLVEQCKFNYNEWIHLVDIEKERKTLRCSPLASVAILPGRAPGGYAHFVRRMLTADASIDELHEHMAAFLPEVNRWAEDEGVPKSAREFLIEIHNHDTLDTPSDLRSSASFLFLPDGTTSHAELDLGLLMAAEKLIKPMLTPEESKKIEGRIAEHRGAFKFLPHRISEVERVAGSVIACFSEIGEGGVETSRDLAPRVDGGGEMIENLQPPISGPFPFTSLRPYAQPANPVTRLTGLSTDSGPRGFPKRRGVILTALPLEFQAAHLFLCSPEEQVLDSGTILEVGTFDTVQGPMALALVEVGAGNSAAGITTQEVLAAFKPEILLFVGVAGGIKDVRLGDVVAATKIYAYESGKSESEFHPRPDVGQSSFRMVQRARAVARGTAWVQRLGVSLDAPEMPRAFVGPMAAGSAVIASVESPLYRFLRAQYGDALAVEMEGKGFSDATFRHKLESIVIRGISDLIEGKAAADASGSQERAARNAAAFAFELLYQLR